MLARLDQELAPLRSSVDHEGNHLRLDGPAEPDAVPRATGLVAAMGYVAAAVEEAPVVARWFTAADVDELSQEEATVLATRWAGGLSDEGVIDDPKRVLAPLTEWLLESFRTAARSGVVEIAPIDEALLRRTLPADEASAVRTWLGRIGIFRDRE